MANEFIIKNGFHSKGNSQVTGSLNISGSIIPNGSGSYDLGSSTNPWRELHILSSSILMYDTSGAISKLTAVRDKGFKFEDQSGALTFMSGSSMRLTNNLRVVNTGSFGYIKGTTISGSYIGDGSNLTGISTTPFPFSGSAVITGSLFVSQSVVDFTSASAVLMNIEDIPLVNPIVEYVDCAAITSSGTDITLPNGLLFVSSSTYEYLEIFINGLRQRYDMDFIPTSTASVEYQVTIPSGSEVTYKSLKRP